MADLLTIYRQKGAIENITVGFCGDLKYGRTVHSLIAALSRYKNINIVLISPDELKLPEYVKQDILDENSMKYIETTSLEEAMPTLDVLYMTRIQRERFDDPEAYERLKNSYILTLDKLDTAKKDMCILHPLPRVNEISVAVDNDERACYFKQVLNGKLMRMALILKLLADSEKGFSDDREQNVLVNKVFCKNPRCISSVEQELDHIFKITDNGIYRCVYCECQENEKESK